MSEIAVNKGPGLKVPRFRVEGWGKQNLTTKKAALLETVFICEGPKEMNYVYRSP